ncbi:proton-conducting membrane transporter [Maricaulis sp.]|uniref:proton-conducting membrane transporter n=1 Tax=Maricaulis sp. TaxID=1486257 RepID=UPI003298ED02
MFWLIWQMGVLLVIFSGLGLLVGYLVWSGDARSIDADKAQADNARLRQENENLARRLGEASARSAPSAEAAPQVAPAAPATPEVAEPEPAAEAAPKPKTKPKAKAKPAAAPKSAAAAKPAAAADAPAKPATASGEDDLTRIKGLGPKAEAALKAGGVTTFAQIAAWSETDVEVWDDRINGRGRIERDSWVGQARDLAG